MVNAKFTIKNYRCFSDEHPLEFEIRDGFIAFVGPNNSGKSFILKFFYEFRTIWNYLFNRSNLDSLLRGGQNSIDFQRIIDKSEVFYRFNNRDISVSIDIENLRFSFRIIRQNISSANLDNATFFLNKDKLIPFKNPAIINNIFYTNKGEININQFFELFDILRTKVIYIPAFRNAVNIGGEDRDQGYYDISIGETFIKTFSQWKLGNYTWLNQRIQDVTEDIKNLFEYESLEINPSDDKKNILLTINRKVYKLHEIGSGIVQFILVFVNAAIKQPSFILIDEPELNFHPQLQLKFLTSLASYTTNGILFATHSMGLARSVADKIYSVIKKDNYSIVKPLENHPHLPEILGELNFTAYQELGIEKILLVEGGTDIKTIQQFLRKIKKDKEFVLISLGGSGMINVNREFELSELKRITPKLYCLIDSERDSENSPLPDNRREFLEICKKLKIKVHVLERRAIENYFSDNAIKKTIGEKYKALEPYKKPNWPKEWNWRIVQNIEFEEIKNTDLGEFLKSI